MWPRRRCRVVTGAASSISRLSSALRDDTTVVATAARAPTASATRSSSSSKSSCPPVDRDCTHWLRGLVCVVRSFRSRARRGCNPQNPLAVLPCFWATRPPFAHARGNDSLRMAAARASSSFQTSRQQLSWLNSLFAVTDNELSNGTDLIPTIADIPLQDFSEA